MVPMSGLLEPGNSYHNTVWGNDYMFSRSPQSYPYLSFSTTAHFTQVLDGATFVRRIPTGTITVYALDFKRGADHVAALWTARGTAEVVLELDRGGSADVSDMFGRSKTMEARPLTLTVSGEPTYVAGGEVKSVAVGRRAYRDDPVPAKAQVAAGAWELSTKPDERLENPPKLGNKNYLTFRQFGKYRMEPVKDEEKGDCVELELLHEGRVVPFLPEYAVVKLKNPAPLEGTPTTVGVWVKGNSGWGQLMWEFQDAEGETWLSCGTGGYFCDVYDWPKRASVNFDGWNFVQFPIVQSSPARLPNPGEVSNQWRSGGGGNGRIDYPIRLTGLAVSMTREALDLTEMKPVKTVVRLKDLSGY
jgi:hypothetical protein